MAIEFDPTNKHIKITTGTSITALEIYNAVMDWVDNPENMGYTIPMGAIGKAPLGGGVYTDSIFILQNGWKIKLYNGNYQFTIFGTVITDDESPRTVPPDEGNVEVIFQVTSQGTVVVSGSGVTQQDKVDIADLVETQTGQPIKTKVNLLPSDPASESTLLELQEQTAEVQTQTTNIEKHHILRRKVEGNYINYYDENNELVMKYRMVKDAEERIIELIPEAI